MAGRDEFVVAAPSHLRVRVAHLTQYIKIDRHLFGLHEYVICLLAMILSRPSTGKHSTSKVSLVTECSSCSKRILASIFPRRSVLDSAVTVVTAFSWNRF